MQGSTATADPIREAERLIAAAGNRGDFADEREALVPYLHASSLLLGAIDAGIEPPERRARAFHLLGVVEIRIGRSFWLSQAEAYLETAILTAPKEPLALESFALLEDYTIAGYTGSAGTDVPHDVRARLDALQRAINEAPGSPAP